MRRLASLWPIAAVLLTLGVGPAAEPAAAQYIYRTIEDPNAIQLAGQGTVAHGINDAGTIVGSYFSAFNVSHGFRFAAGNFTTTDYPGVCTLINCGTEANGINNAGAIVGDYVDDSFQNHGYEQLGGSFITLDFPNSQVTQAWGINDAGAIVGLYVDTNGTTHGFLSQGGAFSTIDPPGAIATLLMAINNSGEIVGNYFSYTTPGLQGFLLNQGAFTPISFPGAFGTQVLGINDAGDIVGAYVNPDASFHGFLLTKGNFITIDLPGAVLTIPDKINNAGEIAGFYVDSQQIPHGFLASRIVLLDPVPDLLNGPAVTTNTQLLATKGRAVQGVAADGVTQVVIQIPANNAGTQFTLRLMNDQQSQSSSADEDGALGKPGDTSFSQSQITVTATAVTMTNGQQVPFAFAVYRAPVDFARRISGGLYKLGTCGSVSDTDDKLACRSVSIQIQDLASGITTTVPVTILRPPLVMIHGLWADWKAWNHFAPLVSDPKTVDSRFYVGRVSYDALIGPSITASDPPYQGLLLSLALSRARANSLGFQFNAPNVLAQIGQWIQSFKRGSSPAGIPAAAVQADIVAHSMGGDIARTLPLQPSFLSHSTFGQGNIHKVITIDTPHLGTPLAFQLLSSQESCMQNFLTIVGDPVFNSVTLSDGETSNGGIADLRGNGVSVDSSLSLALQNIAAPGPHPLPTSLIVGVYTNFANLDPIFGRAWVIRNVVCPDDPLAKALMSSGWPAVFHSQPNDAIVPERSELNNLIPSPGSQFFGYVHSPGTEKLGFSGPSVLDAGPVPNEVIFLLNVPLTNSVYYSLLNPQESKAPMISKLWKALATIVVLVLLFLPASERSLPKILWVVLLIIALTYGISLFVRTQIPTYRRLGIAYLAFVGLSYLMAGIVGLLPNWDLIEAAMWYSLISPHPLMVLLKGLIYSRPFDIGKLPYTVLPASEPVSKAFSITVIILSTVAVVAAFAMARNKRAGYNLWLGFVALSILAALGYVVAQFGKWGMPQYTGPNDPGETIVSLCWAGSYLAAYVMARKGVDIRT